MKTFNDCNCKSEYGSIELIEQLIVLYNCSSLTIVFTSASLVIEIEPFFE